MIGRRCLIPLSALLAATTSAAAAPRDASAGGHHPAATGSIGPAAMPQPPAASPLAIDSAGRLPFPLLSPQASAPPKLATVSADPRPTLQPGTFIETMRAADLYQQIAESGGWPSLPPGSVLKAGDRGPLVATLKERLARTGDLAPEGAAGDVFEESVLAAVRRFQSRHGLPETGLVGAKTVAALNVPAQVRVRQLAASAQRLAGSRFPFDERYVVVNIPAATVEAVENGAVVRRYVAVVGKKDRPSPTLMARITSINFNPTWTLPSSIVRKDIIPQMRKDPGHLAKMKIRLLDGAGREVDPATIDWSTERAADFMLRQDPGAANALGQIRIDMPNRHAVYMHDSPTKHLFSGNARFHSSGCVRVADVQAFAGWLLESTLHPEGPWTREAVEAAIATGIREDVKLSKPVPVAWVYLTGYAMPDGTVHFRDDVYDLDGAKANPAEPGPVAEAQVPLPRPRPF